MIIKVERKAKIRNQYNQVPHLTRDTIKLWESDKNRKHNTKTTTAAVDGTPSQIPAFLPLTFTLGSRSHKMLPSTLYIMSPMHLQILKLLLPTV